MYGQGHNPSVSFADTAYAAGPLCRCATSPHTVGSHPLHKGASNSTPIEFLLAPEGSMWEEYKAPLRKCSHSCIFRRFVL